MMSARLLLCSCLVSLGMLSLPPVAIGQELKPVQLLLTRGGAWNVATRAGAEAGIFKKHGIDPKFEIVSFSTLLTSLPSKATPVSVYSGIAGIEHINQGKDLVVIAGGLVSGPIFVAANSPIRSVKDIIGKKVGTPSVSSSAFQTARVVLREAFDLDLLDRSKVTVIESAAPALLALLMRGEIDVMINITGPSAVAASQPDKARTLFWPNEYWIKKTGVPIAWATPVFAWRDWIDADPQRARGLAAAIHESYEWLRQHPDTMVTQLAESEGRVISPAEAAVYKAWLADENLFVPKWDQKTIDAQWQFLEAARSAGVLSKVPPKEKHAIAVPR